MLAAVRPHLPDRPVSGEDGALAVELGFGGGGLGANVLDHLQLGALASVRSAAEDLVRHGGAGTWN